MYFIFIRNVCQLFKRFKCLFKQTEYLRPYIYGSLFYSYLHGGWSMCGRSMLGFSLHLLVAVLKLWLRPSIQIILLYNLYSIRSMITANLCYKFKCSGYLSCEPVLFPWSVWEQKMLWIRYKMETSNDTFTIWYLY